MRMDSLRVALLCVVAVARLGTDVRADDAHRSKASQPPVAEGDLEGSGDTLYEDRKLREWVEFLRAGRCEELESYNDAAVAVWQFAARDAEAASFVHSAMATSFHDQAWTAKVYQSMLDGERVYHLGLAVDALLADKPSLKESTPILVKRIVEWANSEDEELLDLVNSSLTSIQFRGPLPPAETLLLVKALFPVASRHEDLQFWSWKLMYLLAPCGPEGAELALALFTQHTSRSFAQQIYVHNADRDALQTLATVCQNRQHPRRAVAARLLELRMSIQGIDQPSFIAPALKAFDEEN